MSVLDGDEWPVSSNGLTWLRTGTDGGLLLTR